MNEDACPPNGAVPNPLPRKRPWIQLHLSTCVILMLVAGGLIGLNLHPSTRFGEARFIFNEHMYPVFKIARGWPYAIYEGEEVPNGIEITNNEIPPPDSSLKAGLLLEDYNRMNQRWLPLGIAKNCLVGLAILAITAIGFEWGIKRLARPKVRDQVTDV